MVTTRSKQIAELEEEWCSSPRWKGIIRPYSVEDVVKLHGSINPDYLLAHNGAEKFWRLINMANQRKVM